VTPGKRLTWFHLSPADRRQDGARHVLEKVARITLAMNSQTHQTHSQCSAHGPIIQWTPW
jgi:hypothetical protein